MGPLLARLMKLFLHFYLVFTAGITFSYLLKVNIWFIYLLTVNIWTEQLVLTARLSPQKLLPAGESDFTLKFLEAKFGLNSTT